jgi:hypothetical protein
VPGSRSGDRRRVGARARARVSSLRHRDEVGSGSGWVSVRVGGRVEWPVAGRSRCGPFEGPRSGCGCGCGSGPICGRSCGCGFAPVTDGCAAQARRASPSLRQSAVR